MLVSAASRDLPELAVPRMSEGGDILAAAAQNAVAAGAPDFLGQPHKTSFSGSFTRYRKRRVSVIG